MDVIEEVMNAVTIPVMAKARIGNFVEAKVLKSLEAKDLGAPYELLEYLHQNGKFLVVNFAAGGVATPADAALMMHLSSDGVFVGSGIFKFNNLEKFTKAIVEAITHYRIMHFSQLSKSLGNAMKGIEISSLLNNERMAERGW